VSIGGRDAWQEFNSELIKLDLEQVADRGGWQWIETPVHGQLVSTNPRAVFAGKRLEEDLAAFQI
jgi:hypothetical protein